MTEFNWERGFVAMVPIEGWVARLGSGAYEIRHNPDERVYEVFFVPAAGSPLRYIGMATSLVVAQEIAAKDYKNSFSLLDDLERQLREMRRQSIRDMTRIQDLTAQNSLLQSIVDAHENRNRRESEAFNDLKTHRIAWRVALIEASAREEDSDAKYWDHELRAFDRTFKTLTGE